MSRTLLVLSVVLVGFWSGISSQAQSAITATTIQSTRFQPVSDQDMATQWGLKREEIQKYRRYMALEGRYFYAHLDPVMVLGIIETDPGKRNHYAEKYLIAERRRIEEQTSFATLVGLKQMLLYGPEPLFDFSKLPQAANSPRYQAARAERLSAQRTPTAFSPVKPLKNTAVTAQAGDQVDFLVTPSCKEACYNKLTEVLKTPDVQISLYGQGFANDELISWVKKWETKKNPSSDQAEQIALKKYDPVIFSGIDITTPPIVLLRRNGVVIAQL